MKNFPRISKIRPLGIGAVAAAVAFAGCTSRASSPGAPAPAPPPVVKPPQLAPTRAALAVTPAAVAATDGFASAVRPVLVAHCTPCHEPGGKMYDRMPFDKAETIASHRDVVLRRLKGDDRETVAKWLESQPAAAAPVALARETTR